MLKMTMPKWPCRPALGSRRNTQAMKRLAMKLSIPMMVITGTRPMRWFTAEVSNTSGRR